MLYAIVAVVVIILDQWIKLWVQNSISLESAGKELIPGILSLVNLHNDGAAFSFLSGGGARIYFIILTGAFTVAVIIALATGFISGRFSRWCIVLVTAGGVSNCIDRVIYGYVQDMFKTEFINFPVFNLADVFITVFCLLFVLGILFERDRGDDDEEEFDPDDDEDEDLPRRKPAKARKAARRYEEDDEEEDRRPVKAGKAKSRKAAEDEEYEQYKAQKAARERAAAAAQAQQQKAAQARAQAARQQAAAKPAQQEDPFAEWERATAQAAARQQAAARAAVQQQSAAPVQRPAPVQQARPAAAPQAAPKPAAKPAASSEEFSLDDILAEFK